MYYFSNHKNEKHIWNSLSTCVNYLNEILQNTRLKLFMATVSLISSFRPKRWNYIYYRDRQLNMCVHIWTYACVYINKYIFMLETNDKIL